MIFLKYRNYLCNLFKYSCVALLTPGATQGGANFGRNLPSFGGSSIAENGYYIDGFDDWE